MRNPIVLSAVALTLLAAAAVPATAGQNGAGIWTYSSDITTTIINLTYYTMYLNIPRDNHMVEHDGCCPGTCGDVPWDYGGLKVGPMSTWQEAVDDGCSSDPISWEGVTYFTFSGSFLADSGFDIVAANQDSASDLTSGRNGTWFALSPRDGVGNSWKPASTSTTHCGRYANPVDDYKMHNVMNLINDKVIITLYSSDNNNFVLVAQQFDADLEGWHDCNAYTAYPNEFVDNPGDSVPGQ